MSAFITWQFLLGVFLLAVNCPISTLAVCNVCSTTNNLACVSNTQFKQCDLQGIPSGEATSCLTGFVCSTATAAICQPSDGIGIVPACSECNTCDATNTFACTGVRTYALCRGTTTVSDSGGSCKEYEVCNRGNAAICANATATNQPSCPTVVEPTTPVTNSVEYCKSVQQRGRFPVGDDLTTTCRQLVHCFHINSVL
ncbi:PREDICTED: uncharacterized protein LOC108355056 [Rhagoletis zephyria]|uniref:uncharacterized protein LOC108355056 n=1 Tax=Rhagoletis zephyria TaxID=28612 RepID=UPI0008117167|nr:PREDICTED: uncharacterized protein LOC108355056 [Rhagoletis zephyria]